MISYLISHGGFVLVLHHLCCIILFSLFRYSEQPHTNGNNIYHVYQDKAAYLPTNYRYSYNRYIGSNHTVPSPSQGFHKYSHWQFKPLYIEWHVEWLYPFHEHSNTHTCTVFQQYGL